jgi:uncharacterized membrane protein YccC
MENNTKNLLLYFAKCVAGGVFAFLVAYILDYPDISWFLISIVLVLSPDSNDAIPLAVTRIKANLAGGASSLLLLLIGPPNVITVCAAFVLTISLCYLFKVSAGSRSALAAVVIIMLHGEVVHPWDAALVRVISVIGGCLTGLLITFLFHMKRNSPALAEDSLD